MLTLKREDGLFDTDEPRCGRLVEMVLSLSSEVALSMDSPSCSLDLVLRVLMLLRLLLFPLPSGVITHPESDPIAKEEDVVPVSGP